MLDADGPSAGILAAPIAAQLTANPDGLPPGDSTVGVELTIDRDTTPTPTVTAVGALATPGTARDVVVNGNLIYVCTNTEIAIVDVSDPAHPALAGEFAQSELGAYFEIVACQLLDADHLAVTYAHAPTPTATEFSIYDLSSPLAPSLTSHVSFSQRIGTKVAFVDGSYAILPATIYYYNPFSLFIIVQFGDLLSVDISNLASPSVAGRLFPAGDPSYGGPNMIFGAAEATGHVGLVVSTTAVGDGMGTGPGEGRLLSVDLSSPTMPTTVHETLVPEAVLLHGIAIDGVHALVTGDTVGYHDAASGFVGSLTLSVLDVTDPAAPVVQATVVTALGDKSATPVIAMGSGVFAIAGSTIDNRSEIVLVDTTTPASPRFIPFDVPVPILSMVRQGNFFYAIGADGVTVFELGSVDGPVLTARVELPKGAGVDLVPGSFNLAPTQVLSGTTSDTYVWEQPSGDITWSETFTAMQPGEVRDAVLGGELDFVVPTTGAGQLPLDPLPVAARIVPGTVDAYRCYADRASKGSAKFVPIPSVHVADAFDDVLIQLRKPRALCAPAEPANDPSTDLELYAAKFVKGQPKFAKQTHLRVDDPLGTLVLDAVKLDSLLVPTATNLASAPAPPVLAQHAVDHYQCYKTKIAKGTPKFPRGLEITLGDGLASARRRYLVKKPRLLCAPTDTDGGGVDHAEFQLCYIVKLAKARCADVAPTNPGRSCKSESDCGGTKKVTTYCQKQAGFTPVPGAYTANQFDAERVDVRKATDLCLPALLVP